MKLPKERFKDGLKKLNKDNWDFKDKSEKPKSIRRKISKEIEEK